MGKILFLLVAVTIAVAGCAGSNDEEGARPPQATGDQLSDRTADAYTTIIRRLVESSPIAPRAVYVLDGTVEGSGSPLYQLDEAREPLSVAVKRKIARALDDLPPLAFIDSLESIRGADGECRRPDGPGILIGLGPMSEADGEATISNLDLFDCSDGRLIVYPIGWAEPLDYQTP